MEVVRRFEKTGTKEFINEAIDYCISNHILEEFLIARRTEVVKNMTIDMTFERREVLIREEERAEGRAEGQAERDALKAENERLHAEIERLKATAWK